jgi:hypothetical protein
MTRINLAVRKLFMCMEAHTHTPEKGYSWPERLEVSATGK